MNPRIKELWTTALRSGNYVQGTSFLRRSDNRMCCLGVLCDLHSKETGEDWSAPAGPDPCYAYLGCSGILPDTVRDWAELDSNTPMYSANDGHNQSLISLNDGLGRTFNEIADVIDLHF